MNDVNKTVRLSASKISTLQNCSWLYHAQYILKVPQKRNDGASRGICSHIVLECLLNRRHIEHFKFALKNKRYTAAVERLIRKNAKKYGVADSSNLELIKEMILVGLEQDFFCENSKRVLAEDKFTIETDLYNIVGIIDKLVFYDDKNITIFDYKSSKAKFSQDNLESNIQALIYSLAVYKLYKVIPKVVFIFLRFPRQPLQEVERYTSKQLKGFELFLEQIASHLRAFDEKVAVKNLAINNEEKKWLCGKHGCKKDGSQNFICQYRKPLDYYALINKDSEMVSTSFSKSDLKAGDGNKIVKMHYEGCPHFRFENYTEDDPFNFD